MADRILLDSNLAVLLFVGTTNRNYIQCHKRLAGYDLQDFNLLSQQLLAGGGLVFTPNVLSETSNLARQMKEPGRSEVAAVMHLIITRTQEHYVPSRLASARTDYVPLGLTDAVLLELLAPGTTLLTADLDLYLAAARAKRKAINFNHLREQSRADFR